MVEFIQQAAGPWGQMPGFKGMIEGAMAANMKMMESMNLDLHEFTGQGYPIAPGTLPSVPAGTGPAAGAGSSAEPPQDTAERLRRLDKLREQGLVTAEEHRELRQKIIDSI